MTNTSAVFARRCWSVMVIYAACVRSCRRSTAFAQVSLPVCTTAFPAYPKTHLMITLCPAHHAQVECLQVVMKPMSRLLLQLRRELHSKGHEQTTLDFARVSPVQEPQSLFVKER